jgi:hypothetical protein
MGAPQMGQRSHEDREPARQMTSWQPILHTWTNRHVSRLWECYGRPWRSEAAPVVDGGMDDRRLDCRRKRRRPPWGGLGVDRWHRDWAVGAISPDESQPEATVKDYSARGRRLGSGQPLFIIPALGFGYVAFRDQSWVDIPIIFGVAVVLIATAKWQSSRHV